MKFIKLTKGKRAIVDDKDYKYLNQYKWYYAYGYALRKISSHKNQKNIQMHRLVINCSKNKEIDHINGNKLDNRKSNLREATRSQNAANVPKKKYLKRTSKYKGVHWFPITEKWRAVIKANKKFKHLGYFEKEIDAAKAYNEAALLYFKEYARINNL